MTGSALVGSTGFVGGNLLDSRSFDQVFHSSDVHEMANQHFDEVVFSAAKAEKWRINQDPDRDRVHIDQLESILTSFRTERLVLISTVDVYRVPVDVDEDTAVPEPGLHAYGAHRAELEAFCRDHFDDLLIVRLPGLFGPGIKKNVIYDLLHDNNVAAIDHRGTFQYYDLRRLAADLETAGSAGLTLLNIATEPVSTGRVARECFDVDFTNEPAGSTPGRYDMRSLHASEFGGSDGYLYSAEQVLADLGSFVKAERSKVDAS